MKKLVGLIEVPNAVIKPNCSRVGEGSTRLLVTTRSFQSMGLQSVRLPARWRTRSHGSGVGGIADAWLDRETRIEATDGCIPVIGPSSGPVAGHQAGTQFGPRGGRAVLSQSSISPQQGENRPEFAGT